MLLCLVGISVRGEGVTPQVVKRCFSLAASLRDAGYPAEIDFTGRLEPGFQWVVLVSGTKRVRFMLKDCKRKRQHELASVKEILRVVSKG